ncbi:hypothetical protein [Frigoribacterium sp. PhB160]|uniref:hypothetical protein n=1 Tax=Frigoribacterium sp. PhB160 TaxID=2485192 RepID=UPI0011CECCF6|nr:hypothetical protein [Frigoribacterium sp. PhB160]
MSAENEAIPPKSKAFGIVTAQGRVLDLSDSLTDTVNPRVIWRAHPEGAIHGLSAKAGEHEASVTWISPDEAFHEESTNDAPVSLTAHVRKTYLAYISLCLKLGEFQLEATPITDLEGGITGTSLRARLAARGATWLADLPALDRQRFSRIPKASEVTMVDAPETASPPSETSSAKGKKNPGS